MKKKCQRPLLEQQNFGLNEGKERDGLWIFYETAYELYQSEVIGSSKLYHRYVNDFPNSHTYTDCVVVAGTNEHKKNFHIMEELLTIRKVLVQKYFEKENLCNSDFFAMHQEFNSTQQSPNPEKSIASTSFSVTFTLKPNFQCFFNSIQTTLIVNSANEAHLFSSNVSETEVKVLLTCCLEHPLKSACNRKNSFFL